MSTITNSTVADLVETSSSHAVPNDLAKVAAELVLTHPGDLTQTIFHPVDTLWTVIGRLALPLESEGERVVDYHAMVKYARHAIGQYGTNFEKRASWLHDAAGGLEDALETELKRRRDA